MAIIKGDYKIERDLNIGRKTSININSSIYDISSPLIIDENYGSLIRLNILNSDQNITLPSSITSITSQIILISIEPSSSYNALIQTTNSNLSVIYKLIPGQNVLFLFEGNQWNLVKAGGDAKHLDFDKTTTIGQIINKDNVQEAIEQAYFLAKGIRTFPFELHYVSGSGLNTNMSNGSFFRVRPGTFSSGSYSGYPAAFPLQTPFNCKLYSIVLTFRSAAFDWNANFGPILFEIETRDHVYNGSSILNRILVRFGNFRYSSTGTDTFRYELFYNDVGGEGWSYISGDPGIIDYGKLIGCRFVKAPSGDRRINRFVDIVMKLNYEEDIS